MIGTAGGDLAALRHVLMGSLIGPDDPGYDEARVVWDAGVDRRPLAVARCASAADVSAVVGAARDAGWEITVRGGGHGTGGTCVADGAVMIDLRGLHAVRVDPVRRLVRVGGGATLPRSTRPPPPTAWPPSAAPSAASAWAGPPSAVAWAG